MTEPGEREQGDQPAETSSETDDDKEVNDPLTRSDVEAPRAPFGSDGPSKD